MTNQMIFVNLPVADLDRAKKFWADLGYEFNPQFTDENAACLVFSDTIFAMLLRTEFFTTFTGKQIADSAKSTEVLLGLSAESREAVDALVDKAVAAGGRESRDPMDHGVMYQRSFEDPDGHTWEIIWMDPANIQN
ncbi:VOC family protein [Amycolatopsis thermophila]|uniref:Lactoylglutathione lyase n=1 Tax=Amycolatopsis thermophila TaxID=206084 RepID=A0ABU0F205_9PSEU|nr:VOC family protein [Amycolatopsis thermophila]MDQ0381618.1 putative lactoylglutathione lyase [Amycolatopsis thermophila]